MAGARVCCASGASRKPPTASGGRFCSTRITSQSNLGLSVALRAMGSQDAADATWRKTRAILDTLAATRPIEAAIVHSQLLAVDGKPEDAGAILCKALDEAPPGFAAWTLPIEPFLLQLAGTEAFTSALTRLSERAR